MVVAYALYNLSAANEESSKSRALRNRDGLARLMSSQAIEAGQKLTLELGQQGNFLKALDASVRRPRVKEAAMR